MNRLNRTVASIVLVCFLFNTALQDYAFGLGVMPGTSQEATRLAALQKGIEDLAEKRPEVVEATDIDTERLVSSQSAESIVVRPAKADPDMLKGGYFDVTSDGRRADNLPGALTVFLGGLDFPGKRLFEIRPFSEKNREVTIYTMKRAGAFYTFQLNEEVVNAWNYLFSHDVGFEYADHGRMRTCGSLAYYALEILVAKVGRSCEKAEGVSPRSGTGLSVLDSEPYQNAALGLMLKLYRESGEKHATTAGANLDGSVKASSNSTDGTAAVGKTPAEVKQYTVVADDSLLDDYLEGRITDIKTKRGISVMTILSYLTDSDRRDNLFAQGLLQVYNDWFETALEHGRTPPESTDFEYVDDILAMRRDALAVLMTVVRELPGGMLFEESAAFDSLPLAIRKGIKSGTFNFYETTAPAAPASASRPDHASMVTRLGSKEITFNDFFAALRTFNRNLTAHRYKHFSERQINRAEEKAASIIMEYLRRTQGAPAILTTKGDMRHYLEQPIGLFYSKEAANPDYKEAFTSLHQRTVDMFLELAWMNGWIKEADLTKIPAQHVPEFLVQTFGAGTFKDNKVDLTALYGEFDREFARMQESELRIYLFSLIMSNYAKLGIAAVRDELRRLMDGSVRVRLIEFPDDISAAASAAFLVKGHRSQRGVTVTNLHPTGKTDTTGLALRIAEESAAGLIPHDLNVVLWRNLMLCMNKAQADTPELEYGRTEEAGLGTDRPDLARRMTGSDHMNKLAHILEEIGMYVAPTLFVRSREPEAFRPDLASMDTSEPREPAQPASQPSASPAAVKTGKAGPAAPDMDPRRHVPPTLTFDARMQLLLRRGSQDEVLRIAVSAYDLMQPKAQGLVEYSSAAQTISGICTMLRNNIVLRQQFMAQEMPEGLRRMLIDAPIPQRSPPIGAVRSVAPAVTNKGDVSAADKPSVAAALPASDKKKSLGQTSIDMVVTHITVILKKGGFEIDTVTKAWGMVSIAINDHIRGRSRGAASVEALYSGIMMAVPESHKNRVRPDDIKAMARRLLAAASVGASHGLREDVIDGLAQYLGDEDKPKPAVDETVIAEAQAIYASLSVLGTPEPVSTPDLPTASTRSSAKLTDLASHQAMRAYTAAEAAKAQPQRETLNGVLGITIGMLVATIVAIFTVGVDSMLFTIPFELSSISFIIHSFGSVPSFSQNQGVIAEYNKGFLLADIKMTYWQGNYNKLFALLTHEIMHPIAQGILRAAALFTSRSQKDRITKNQKAEEFLAYILQTLSVTAILGAAHNLAGVYFSVSLAMAVPIAYAVSSMIKGTPALKAGVGMLAAGAAAYLAMQIKRTVGVKLRSVQKAPTLQSVLLAMAKRPEVFFALTGFAESMYGARSLERLDGGSRAALLDELILIGYVQKHEWANAPAGYTLTPKGILEALYLLYIEEHKRPIGKVKGFKSTPKTATSSRTIERQTYHPKTWHDYIQYAYPSVINFETEMTNWRHTLAGRLALKEFKNALRNAERRPGINQFVTDELARHDDWIVQRGIGLIRLKIASEIEALLEIMALERQAKPVASATELVRHAGIPSAAGLSEEGRSLASAATPQYYTGLSLIRTSGDVVLQRLPGFLAALKAQGVNIGGVELHASKTELNDETLPAFLHVLRPYDTGIATISPEIFDAGLFADLPGEGTLSSSNIDRRARAIDMVISAIDLAVEARCPKVNLWLGLDDEPDTHRTTDEFSRLVVSMMACLEYAAKKGVMLTLEQVPYKREPHAAGTEGRRPLIHRMSNVRQLMESLMRLDVEDDVLNYLGAIFDIAHELKSNSDLRNAALELRANGIKFWLHANDESGSDIASQHPKETQELFAYLREIEYRTPISLDLATIGNDMSRIAVVAKANIDICNGLLRRQAPAAAAEAASVQPAVADVPPSDAPLETHDDIYKAINQALPELLDAAKLVIELVLQYGPKVSIGRAKGSDAENSAVTITVMNERDINDGIRFVISKEGARIKLQTEIRAMHRTLKGHEVDWMVYTFCTVADGADAVKEVKSMSRGFLKAIEKWGSEKPSRSIAKKEGQTLISAPSLGESSGRRPEQGRRTPAATVDTQNPVPVARLGDDRALVQGTAQNALGEVAEIIDEFKIPVNYANREIPAKRLGEEELRGIIEAVNLFHQDRIEIFIDKTVDINERTKRIIDGINAAIRKKAADKDEKEPEDIINCGRGTTVFSDEQDLERLLNRPARGKRMIITAATDAAKQGRLIAMAGSFGGVRLINVAPPDNYANMTEKERSFFQLEAVGKGIYGRVIKRDSPIWVRTAFAGMLEGSIDGDIGTYIDNLIKPDSEWESPQKRIGYFLGRMVRLSRKIAEEYELLKLRMRTFYVAA